MSFSLTSDISELQKIAHELRIDVLEMLNKAGSGHIGGPFGMADIFATLYFSFLRIDSSNPTDPKRDYCLLSNGHICPIWYATLAKRGFFPREELWKLRKIDSLLQGHPKLSIPGVENASGPLGHGLSQAVGIALALRANNKEKIINNKEDQEQEQGENKNLFRASEKDFSVSSPPEKGGKEGGFGPERKTKNYKPKTLSQRVVCCMSDGEHQEGQNWEAAMSAVKWNLDNLIAIMDYNGLQIEGKTDEIMPLGNLAEKYSAFGWEVREIDGHDFKQILEALEWASSKPQEVMTNDEGRMTNLGTDANISQRGNRPKMIIAHTILGKGVSFMENNWHYHDWPAKAGEYEKALSELSLAK